MELALIKDGATRTLLIYAWRCTPGGPRGVRRADEWRVQITRPQAGPLARRRGAHTLLIGYWEQGDVLALWDVRVHPNPGASSSLQVAESTLREAAAIGWSAQDRELSAGRSEIVIACSPESLCLYLEELPTLRVRPAAKPDVEATAAAANAEASESEDGLPIARRRALRQMVVGVRDVRFVIG
jgi:hypothetical protein